MGRLSDTAVRAAKAFDTPYKLTDGEQLYLHVSPAGGRHWLMNYQFGHNAQGKPRQKTLTIGSYPAISLKDACEARDEAKTLLAKGREPKPADLFRADTEPQDSRPRFERWQPSGWKANGRAGRRSISTMLRQV